MKKMMKHLYAILLVVVLIATLLPTSIFAAPGKGKGRGKNKQEKITETVMETEPTETVLDENGSEETAQEDSLKIETPAEAPVEDVSVEEPIEEASTEKPAEEIPAEEPVVEETVVEEDVEETFDAITVENMAVEGSDNLLVSVYAPEGAFKTGTEVFANAVPVNKVQESVDNTEGVEGTVLAAVDITFMFDGEEQQPSGDLPVSVSFITKNLIANTDVAESLSVIHVDKISDEAEKVENIEINQEAEIVSFETDTFSVYALMDESETDIQSANILVRSLAAPNLKAQPAIAASKDLTDNHDGTQKISLNITGASEQSEITNASKSNVVLIIDVSGSMNDGIDAQAIPYTYEESTYSSDNYYLGIVNNEWVLIDRNDNNTGWEYRTGRWPNYNYYSYNDQAYWYVNTRLSATKAAAYQLVDALLENNTAEIPDIVEISIEKFASRNGTQVLVHKSVSASELKTAIRNLSAGGGTNWEAALKTAKDEAGSIHSEGESTSIIFLTDGKPTLYGSENGTGQEDDSNVRTCWNNANDDARNIITDGYDLYNIFAYGSGSEYLSALTNYAYTGKGTYADSGIQTYADGSTTEDYFYDATDTDSLLEAFQTIIDKINKNVGFAGVEFEDGVTLGVTNTSVVVDGTIHEGSFHYTVKDSKGNVAYTVKIENGKAVFTIDGTEYTDTAAEEVVTKIDPNDESTWIKSTVYSVTAGEDDTEYKMSPAVINKDTGLIDWDLAGLGILQNGYTYTLDFDVWPNQLAYDMMADLNNGVTTLDKVEADIKASQGEDAWNQIADSVVVTFNGTTKIISRLTDEEKAALANGSVKGQYSIYTNWKQEVTYYTAEEETDESGNVTTVYSDKQTSELDQPNAVALTSSTMQLRKLWADELDSSQLQRLLYDENGNSRNYKVELKIWKADTVAELDTLVQADADNYYKKVILGWNGTAYVWDDTLDVAPGIMIDEATFNAKGLNASDYDSVTYNGTVYYLLEKGHYYTVSEVTHDYHFDLVTIVYHPMLVNGTLSNVTFKADGTVENIKQMSTVDATNTLRGGINLTKTVLDPDGNEYPTDDKFEFTIVLDNEDGVFVGNNIPWYGVNGKYYHDNDGNYIDNTATGDQDQDGLADDGNIPVVTNNGKTATYTISINATDYVRINNVPINTLYKITETQIDGFTLDSVITEIGYDSVKVDEEGNPVIDEDGNPVTERISEKEVTTNELTVEGEIEPNRENNITYKNKMNTYPAFYVYHSSDCTIEKILASDERVTRTIDKDTGLTKLTFDIVNETKEGFLYGGYYKSYVGAVASNTQINETSETGKLVYSEGWTTDKEGAAPYTYEYIKTKDRGAWSTDYYTDTEGGIGTAMHPEKLKVYYLKEVPAAYLLPYTHYTYNKGDKALRNMWYLSSVDDLNYEKAGFFVETFDKDGKKDAIVVDTLTVTNATGGATVKLSPKSVFGNKGGVGKGVQAGYLDYWEASDLIKADTKSVFTPFWYTMDKVYVCGVSTRTVTFNNAKVGAGGMRIKDAANTDNRFPVVAAE